MMTMDVFDDEGRVCLDEALDFQADRQKFPRNMYLLDVHGDRIDQARIPWDFEEDFPGAKSATHIAIFCKIIDKAKQQWPTYLADANFDFDFLWPEQYVYYPL